MVMYNKWGMVFFYNHAYRREPGIRPPFITVAITFGTQPDAQ